ALVGAVDRRRVLTVAMLVFVAGNAIAATSSSFFTLLMAQLVMGAATGLFAATAQATAVALTGPDQRALAISVVAGGTTFAVALGAPLGSLIATFWGWRGTFLSVAGLGSLTALVLWWRLPAGMRGTRLPLADRFLAITRPGVAPALLVTLLYLTGAFVMISYLAPLAMAGAGLPKIALSGMLLSFGIGAVIGNLTSGFLADRIGAGRVVVLSLLLSITICLLIAAGLKLLPHHLSGPLLIGIMLPWGIVGWAFPPAQASRVVSYAPDVAHLTLSLNASAIYFGVALGTVVGGRVLEYAAASDLGLVAATLPFAALVFMLAGRVSRKRLTAQPAE
ncbi:MAG: MFS transporter, partial [Mesorhizobium sp.]|nr:MFS transporter [Mesorhizobium sp.]